MAIQLVTKIQQWIGLASDDRPGNTPDRKLYPGSTYHAWDTGETFIWDGENWQQDLRLIYALSQIE